MSGRGPGTCCALGDLACAVDQRLASDTPSYPGLTAEAIERDLRAEPPQWIMSCYGPGRDAPEQLWGGYPREQSPEEIRLHFMLGAMAGNPQGAVGSLT